LKEADLYLQLAERHGHYCPMSTLGLRLGLEALRRLADSKSVDWQFCYQVKTCAADGITLALENSSFFTELLVDQQGQHSLLCESVDGKELSLSLSTEAMRLAAQYRELNDDEKNQHLDMLRSVVVEQIIDVAGFVD